jgi:TPR repeat protein
MLDPVLRHAAAVLSLLTGCAGNGQQVAATPDADAADSEAPSMAEVSKLMRTCRQVEVPTDAAIACLALGALAEMGLGGATSPEQADEMYARGHLLLVSACDEDDGEACALLGALQADKLRHLPPESDEARRVAARATPWLERACRAGQPLSCAVLGQMYDEGLGVGIDTERAAHYFDEACKGGEELACGRMGRRPRAHQPAPRGPF